MRIDSHDFSPVLFCWTNFTLENERLITQKLPFQKGKVVSKTKTNNFRDYSLGPAKTPWKPADSMKVKDMFHEG